MTTPYRRSVPKRRPPEPEGQDLVDRRPRVEREISAGDTQVEFTGADVDRNVLGAEEEELDTVGRIEHRQILGVTTASIARFAENLGGGFGQGTFVGNSYAQHCVILRS